MNYFFLSISILALQLNAQELNKEEFPYIQPISVEVVGTSTASSFLDTDEDGIVDNKDQCPKTLQNTSVNIFGCALMTDNDNDGVDNQEDQCPKTKEGTTVDAQGCPPDSDADGIIDSKDECSNTTQGFVVNKAGCPQTTILKVNFKSSKHEILPSSFDEIEKFAFFLQENISYDIIIYGYTDSINKSGNNKKLSQKRANAVMNALIEHGVKQTRLTAIGMGSKNPIADNNTPEGRAENRRIEIELI